MGLLTDVHGRGVFASRPAAGHAGRFYFSTDTLVNYRDNGSSWDAQGTSGLVDPLTTRGDLIVRGASSTGRLAVGAANRALVSDGTDPSWGQVTPAILDVSADNTTANATSGHHGLLPKLSGSGTDVLKGDGTWGAGAGGGVTHSYAGYNAIGGSTENVGDLRQYMKKITLASAAEISSIGMYLKQITAGEIIAMAVGLLDDAAGSPGKVIAIGQSANASSGQSAFLSTANGSAGAARWVHMPLGFWATAADYWLVVCLDLATVNSHQVYFDSGSDRYFTNGLLRITDSGWTTVTTSSNKYSIRADLLA
jgi:fructose-specific component phosphotransferase system IIB-like protein